MIDFDKPAEEDAIYQSRLKKIVSDDLVLYNENSLNVMRKILEKYPNGCFDMIFADPPYFLSNDGFSCQNGQMVSVNKGNWDKSKGMAADLEFYEEWLRLCYALLKPNGTIWVCGTFHNIYLIGYLMQTIGYHILNNITWEKPNPPPNLSCRFFTHSTETILWAKKNKKAKHTFHYEMMKAQNDGKQMKCVWTFPPPNKAEKTFGKHPTQKPLPLLERCILSASNIGDLIFDPFMGSGTTGVAALKHGRKFCGCELEEDFFELAKKKVRKMIIGGIGGARTQTGLRFEERTDLRKLFEEIPGYDLRKTYDNAGYEVWFNGELKAYCFKKYEFYRFLKRPGYSINWKDHLSKRLLPDNGLFIIIRDTLFIIEIKFQQTPGSVDEKLQTCDFKRKQYTKLVHSLGWRVEYVYVLNDWFTKPEYKDVLDYIISVNCHYQFNTIPLRWFGLPDGETNE